MTEQYVECVCEECKVLVLQEQRYCYNCGALLGTDPETINIFNNSDLRQIFIFYFIYLFICLLVKHTSGFNSYDELFWVEIVLALVTIRYVWKNREFIKPVLIFNNFHWSVLAGIVTIAAAGSLMVSFTVRELNVTFFETEISYYRAYKMYHFPVLIMIYSIALMPAIFEELAFRGVMYHYCSNFLDDRLVVAVTAFLFAIMHLSFISLIWLIPFGFFIGYLRRQYNTLWYGIIFHFTFNLVACLYDLYKQGDIFKSIF